MDNTDFYIVAAIDFGTSFSGIAYCTKKDITKHHLSDIHHVKCWGSGKFNREKFKTASCILFDEKEEFVAFGYDAREKFYKHQRDRKQDPWYFFTDLKMFLYRFEKSLSTYSLTNEQGQKMLAKKVITASIKALVTPLLKALKDAGKETPVTKIRWVLTVPAIWNDVAKIFMKECAEAADIPNENLIIALEPEAASIFCQYHQVDHRDTPPGTKYLVVDIGGGTTDITFHEKRVDNGLRELYPAHGKDIGGTTLDLVLLRLLESCLSYKLLMSLKQEKPCTYLDLYTELEDLKKSVTDESEDLSIRFPTQTITDINSKFTKMSLSMTIGLQRMESRKENVKIEDDRLFFKSEEIKQLFNKEFRSVSQTVIQILKSSSEDVTHIIMVGGVSENSYFRNKMRTLLKQCTKTGRLIFPEDGNLAVLNGAVMFGLDPFVISPRKTKYNYGVTTSFTFNKDKHDISRLFLDDFGHELCKRCFGLIIEQNKSVSIDNPIKNSYSSTSKYQKIMTMSFYYTRSSIPLYSDDNECIFIGKINVNIPFPSDEKRSINMTFAFGDTFLQIKTKDRKYGIEDQAKIELP